MPLVDTGVLLAAADDAEPDHGACAQLLADERSTVTTALVVAEAGYLIDRQLAPAACG